MNLLSIDVCLSTDLILFSLCLISELTDFHWGVACTTRWSSVQNISRAVSWRCTTVNPFIRVYLRGRSALFFRNSLGTHNVQLKIRVSDIQVYLECIPHHLHKNN